MFAIKTVINHFANKFLNVPILKLTMLPKTELYQTLNTFLYVDKQLEKEGSEIPIKKIRKRIKTMSKSNISVFSISVQKHFKILFVYV
jgi:hypothetical protein